MQWSMVYVCPGPLYILDFSEIVCIAPLSDIKGTQNLSYNC